MANRPPRLACFVTPHGFGHAARICAVLVALGRRLPGLGVELFTTVPRWFFDDSLALPFGYHLEDCDVGLVQRDALTEDVAATVARLEALLPFRPQRLDALATRLLELGCTAVLCDVAPLGLAVARHAGLPAALLENFTWDWIYRAYLPREPRLAPFLALLAAAVDGASLHLQARPCCQPRPAAVALPPVARAVRQPRAEVRARLAAGAGERLVLVTMGGIRWSFADLDRLAVPAGITLVLPGAADVPRQLPRARLLPHRSGFFHPDLVAACDAVVGKLGYSTVAEVCQAGLPLGYVPRRSFPESPVLERFVVEEMAGLAIGDDELDDGRWCQKLEPLLALPRAPGCAPDGAEQAAARLAAWWAPAGVRESSP